MPTQSSSASLLQQCPVLAPIGLAGCQEIAQHHAVHTVPADAPIELTDSSGRPTSIVFLLRGTAAVFDLSDSERRLTRLVQGPAMLDDSCLADDTASPCDARALTQAQILSLPRELYRGLVLRYPLMGLEHIRCANSAAWREMRRQRLDTRLTARVAALLLDLAELVGQPLGPGATVIPFQLSQRRLSSWLGVTQRGISEIMAPWMRLGVIRKQGRQLVLQDRITLEDAAGELRGLYGIAAPATTGGDGADAVDAPTATQRDGCWQLVLLNGPGSLKGRIYDVDQGIDVGRRAPCQLVLSDDHVSIFHCSITRDADGALLLRDLDSLNGTLVNGRPVTQAALRHGDVIQVGLTRMELRDASLEQTAASRRPTPPPAPSRDAPERRRHARHRVTITARLVTEAQSGEAVITNISAGGLFMETPSSLTPGQTVSLDLSPGVTQQARVVRQGSDGYGCAILSGQLAA